MHARPWMSRCRAKIEAADRCLVAEPWKGRAPEELMVKSATASAQVAPHKILIHSLQIVRSKNGSAKDRRAKSRGQLLDALFDAIGESFLGAVPASRLVQEVRHARIGPER